jgi:hypothetical protein
MEVAFQPVGRDYRRNIAGVRLKKIVPTEAKPCEIIIDKANRTMVAIKTFLTMMFSHPFSSLLPKQKRNSQKR